MPPFAPESLALRHAGDPAPGTPLDGPACGDRTTTLMAGLSGGVRVRPGGSPHRRWRPRRSPIGPVHPPAVSARDPGLSRSVTGTYPPAWTRATAYPPRALRPMSNGVTGDRHSRGAVGPATLTPGVGRNLAEVVVVGRQRAPERDAGEGSPLGPGAVALLDSRVAGYLVEGEAAAGDNQSFGQETMVGVNSPQLGRAVERAVGVGAGAPGHILRRRGGPGAPYPFPGRVRQHADDPAAALLRRVYAHRWSACPHTGQHAVEEGAVGAVDLSRVLLEHRTLRDFAGHGSAFRRAPSRDRHA